MSEVGSHLEKKSTTIATASAQAVEPKISDWNMRCLTTDQSAIYALFQAAEYYNACILEDLTPIHELGRHPYIHHVSPERLKEAILVPEFLRSGLICMTLNHRMNRLGIRSNPGATDLVEKYYIHWGITIRSLSEQFNVENKRTSDVVIAGILTILLGDIQNGAQVSWLHHLDGIHKLVSLRGGFRALAPSQRLAPLLNCLWFIGIITNTTCPASYLNLSTISHFEASDFMQEHYSFASTPTQMFPPQLLAEVSKINYLRLQAKSKKEYRDEHLSKDAYNILESIEAFSPEESAQSKFSSKEDWMRIGTVYRSATALYCILSLQSVSVLPEDSALRTRCVIHGQVLLRHLPESLSSARTKRFMLWPLVLLGVEAVHSDMATRAFVSKQLPELSRSVGTSIPLTAQSVLESFWASGLKLWDACFDRPYPFTMQIAVDVSQVSTP
ncbi:Phomenoic acid biosynthesis cluster-specific transcriptional regulator [Plenodomus lingam]|uniref:Phomenoic acid biosynthesis cluster-specific transcriptional regulator n=1 Tax=Leptosphaeria maculans TaxID=5022 RepID=UPI003332E93B|nr:Phomenoic acid biosynthesis cluster-specific transcriptional regulator [Plenodomus lingam]